LAQHAFLKAWQALDRDCQVERGVSWRDARPAC
jgi:hypothetical protein